MRITPIDERAILVALPGMEQLSTVEQESIEIKSFEYNSLPVLSTITLRFSYTDAKGVVFPLVYEMTYSSDRGLFLQHVVYETHEVEKEFPDFRKAIDYIQTEE